MSMEDFSSSYRVAYFSYPLLTQPIWESPTTNQTNWEYQTRFDLESRRLADIQLRADLWKYHTLSDQLLESWFDQLVLSMPFEVAYQIFLAG